jgi:hypothetical protein
LQASLLDGRRRDNDTRHPPVVTGVTRDYCVCFQTIAGVNQGIDFDFDGGNAIQLFAIVDVRGL